MNLDVLNMLSEVSDLYVRKNLLKDRVLSDVLEETKNLNKGLKYPFVIIYTNQKRKSLKVVDLSVPCTMHMSSRT